ncbi:MAG: DNA polymerase III subunit gamma/tau [Opitutae bacterium]|nr:DNA polymerase III subunit gamma/tau [Opitutae bacterium]|tara:strand:+ start:2245 stop:3174 length:930 start_codon:yes stop_codon:yes gene_type:complete
MPASSETSHTKRSLLALETAIAEDRLPHALLLHGDDLTEIEEVCLGLTRHLLGMKEDDRQHPDLQELRSRGAARIIDVKQAREMIKDLNHAPSQGTHKVAIIHEADRMKVAAANALLKTLEEPPGNTTIFLITTRPYSLLDTIRSRCQRFRVSFGSARERLPEWSAWLNNYRGWLSCLGDPAQVRKDTCGLVLAVFGLIYQFDVLLSKWTSEAWQSAKEGLPDELDDKELLALESGCRKGLRHQLFIDLETETHAFAVAQKDDKLPAIAIGQAIETLEQAVGLLELNIKETVAIEHFLLSSLRIWTSRN